MQSDDWSIQPGEHLSRAVLHATYGGRTQGSIGPSRKTPNVLLFADPVSAEQHGYYNGWQLDGHFHYTGEGQRGDQRMLSGNRSILEHVQEDRALRLFQGARGEVEYIGRFQLANSQPWYETDAPETKGGPIRKIIVFRLLPIDVSPPQRPMSKIAAVFRGSKIVKVAIEEHRTERSYIDPNREPYFSERVESRILQALAAYWRSQNREICRLQIVPDGEYRPLFTDLYDMTHNILVEAKGSVTREAVRMALGQLADYSRFVPRATCTILLPSRPRPDLEELLHAQGIELLWAVGDGFESTRPDLLKPPQR